MILYANSDSYGILSTGKTYVDYIGQQLDFPTIINHGYPGSCNERILRTTVRDLIDIKKNNKEDIFALIGLAPVNRFEYWSQSLPAISNDGQFYSLLPQTKKILPEAKNFHKAKIELYDEDAANTNLFLQLILLTAFFKTNNIKYLIWQGSMTLKETDFDAPFINTFYKQIKTDQCILDLFNFGFSYYCSIIKKHTPYDYHLYKEYGHHGERAHKDFADYLITHYIEKIINND